MQIRKEGFVLFILFLGVLTTEALRIKSQATFRFFLPYRIYFGEVQLNGLGEGMYQG